MKIIQIGTFPQNPQHIKGGVEASVYGLSKALNQNNEVLVLDLPNRKFDHDYSEFVDEMQVYRYTCSGSTNMSMNKRLQDYKLRIIEEKPDVCHLHTTSLFCFLLYLFLRWHHIPTMLTIHGLAHIEQKNKLCAHRSVKSFSKYVIYSFVEYVFLFSIKEIIVDTFYVERIIKSYRKPFGIWRMPICHVIPQGIDASFFSLEEKEKEKYQILAVGAFSKRKGYLSLFDAIKNVLETGMQIKVICCGFIAEPLYFEKMKSKVRELNLYGCVELFNGLSQVEIQKYYINSELFVLYSQEESQGIVLAEAMAAGLPIVATNVGGIPDVVKQGKNGFLSDYNDVHTFSENIKKILLDEDERRSMSQNNKKDAFKYSWKKISGDIEALYEKMCHI